MVPRSFFRSGLCPPIIDSSLEESFNYWFTFVKILTEVQGTRCRHSADRYVQETLIGDQPFVRSSWALAK